MEEDQNPNPQTSDNLRCTRNDGRKWRCPRKVMEGKKFCQNHYLQNRHRTHNEHVPDSLLLKPSKRIDSSTKEKKRKRLDVLYHAGDEVEVTSYGEGLDGSWYVATIIQSPSTNDDSYYVAEYHTLMEEEGSSVRLRELFDVVNIRPRPPVLEEDVGKVFQVREEVDAYYNDGWWHGEILKVIEDVEEEEAVKVGKRSYCVYFAWTKEKIEFGQKELRSHLDWIDGCWVKPPVRVRENRTAMQFSEGKEDPSEENCFKEENRNPMQFSEGCFKEGKMEEMQINERNYIEVSSDEEGIQESKSLRALLEQASKVPALEEKCKAFGSMEKWKSCFTSAVSQAEDEMAWASIKLALDVMDFPLEEFNARLRKIAVEQGIQNSDAIFSLSPVYLFPERQKAVRSVWDKAVQSAFSGTFH